MVNTLYALNKINKSRRLTPPRPSDSFRSRAADKGRASPDQAELPAECEWEWDSAAAADGERAIGKGTFRGLTPRDATRVGRINRSATEDAGETARWCAEEEEARGGMEPDGDAEAEAETECCCWFLARVGVNSGPESRERKREERRDSSSSS